MASRHNNYFISTSKTSVAVTIFYPKRAKPRCCQRGVRYTTVAVCSRVVEYCLRSQIIIAYLPPQMMASIPKDVAVFTVAGSQLSSRPRFSPGSVKSAPLSDTVKVRPSSDWNTKDV